MKKYCTLKELVPGSVVDYKAAPAVILGLQYSSDQTKIGGDLLLEKGDRTGIVEFMPFADHDTKLEVLDNPSILERTRHSFLTQSLKLPSLPMSCGCDPEIFVEHGDGSIFPAYEFLPDEATARKTAKSWLADEWNYKPDPGVRVGTAYPGNYWNIPGNVMPPVKVPMYWDGPQAEFAPWAKSCLEVLHSGTQIGLRDVLNAARAIDPNARLSLRNVIQMPEDILKNAKDEHIQFRCTPSFNIYDDTVDGLPNSREYPFRCAGGHIHIGSTRVFTAPTIEQIVRGLDAVLGVAGVSMAAGIDNPERRRMYGRAGEFRLPKHGVEYRVLSNFWLCHPALAMLVFELARITVRLAESGLFHLCWKATDEETRQVINTCDVKGARAILQRNVSVLAAMFGGLFLPCGEFTVALSRKCQTMALQTILKGIDVVIPKPEDIAGNWMLDDPSWKKYCRSPKCTWQSLIMEMEAK